ncbi:MAG: hypothetical protein KatS3mg088_117 [Patescibacteria group bacterium]|nr:MAG: hypothetical protein KatS3mg088_117 [Patescibacteria group bacterium]
MLQIFGPINSPEALSKFGSVEGGAIGKLLNLIIRTLIVGAGIYALINLVLAGYAFISAGDDPKKVAGAWAKIWQTLLGLAVAAGAFVLAAIFGYLLFGNPQFLLKPSIPTL